MATSLNHFTPSDLPAADGFLLYPFGLFLWHGSNLTAVTGVQCVFLYKNRGIVTSTCSHSSTLKKHVFCCCCALLHATLLVMMYPDEFLV